MAHRADAIADTLNHIRRLGLRRDLSHLDQLVDALEHSSPEVRRLAARALGWLRSPLAEAPLMNALGDEDPQVRRWTAMSLALCGGRSALPLLQLQLHQDTDPLNRAAAARTLGWLSLDEAREPLRSSLTDPAPLVRGASIEALGRLKDVDSLHEIIKSLSDSTASVRRHAARVVGTMLEDGTTQPLEEHATDPDPEVRAIVIRCLAKSCPAIAETYVLKGLEDGNPGVRSTAAIALRTMGKPAYLAKLDVLQDDPNPEVKHQVRQSIDALRALQSGGSGD